jgi:lipopolysaccharide export system permease protein
MIRLLFRYLFVEVSKGILLATSIVGALVFVVDYVELSRRMDAQPDVNSLEVLQLTFMKLPGMIEQTLPFIVLFGVMWVMFALNRRNELVAMRAASMSAWQFALPSVLIAVFLGLVGTAALNPLAASLNAQFERKRITLLSLDGPDQQNINTLWFREATGEGIRVIRAGNVVIQTATLYDLTFYDYTMPKDRPPVITQRIDAKKARLEPGLWQIEDAVMVLKNQPPKHFDTLVLPTTIAPSALLGNSVRASGFSLYALPRMINESKKAGFGTRRYRLQLHQLLSLPLTLAAMALIGASFSFKLVRLGGTLRLTLTAGAAGFALYFASDLLQTLGATQILPPFVAIWAAPIFVFFAGLARITILEDG